MHNHLILQPFGAVSIDADDCGSLEILNPVASLMAKGLAGGLDHAEVCKEVAAVYEVNDMDEVLADIKEFDGVHGYSSRRWEVSGNEEALSISTVNVEMTHKCDLRCSYCYIEGSPRKGEGELDAGEWDKVADWIGSHRVSVVTLTGGNPMVSPSFWSFVRRLHEYGVGIRLFTTGEGITPEVAEELKALGVFFVEISLDSIDPDIHNRYRCGSHAKAKSAIEALAGAGVSLGIGTSIYSDNVGEIPGLIKFAESVGAKFRCGTVMSLGRAAGLPPEFFIDEAQKRQMAETLMAAAENGVDLELDFAGGKYEEDGGRCDVSYGIVVIDPQGRIKPCLKQESFFSASPWAISGRRSWEYTLAGYHRHAALFDRVDSSCLPGDECDGLSRR